MGYTNNLHLYTTPESDNTTTFKDWRVGMNGDVDSNMTKIDAAYGQLKTLCDIDASANAIDDCVRNSQLITLSAVVDNRNTDVSFSDLHFRIIHCGKNMFYYSANDLPEEKPTWINSNKSYMSKHYGFTVKLPNGNYCISASGKPGMNTDGRAIYCVLNSSDSSSSPSPFVSAQFIFAGANSGFTNNGAMTFTIENDMYSLYVLVRGVDTYASAKAFLNNMNIQIERGSIDTSFEEYSADEYEVILTRSGSSVMYPNTAKIDLVAGTGYAEDNRMQPNEREDVTCQPVHITPYKDINNIFSIPKYANSVKITCSYVVDPTLAYKKIVAKNEDLQSQIDELRSAIIATSTT